MYLSCDEAYGYESGMSYVYVDILGENTRVQLYSGFFGIQVLGMGAHGLRLIGLEIMSTKYKQ